MPCLSSLSALDASGRHDPERRSAFPGHEPRHLVQAEPRHHLSVHLKNLISDTQEADIWAFASAVTHFLYVNTWGGEAGKGGQIVFSDADSTYAKLH